MHCAWVNENRILSRVTRWLNALNGQFYSVRVEPYTCGRAGKAAAPATCTLAVPCTRRRQSVARPAHAPPAGCHKVASPRRTKAARRRRRLPGNPATITIIKPGISATITIIRGTPPQLPS
eukprot:4432433-Pyramimonas_sp.AAC.1